jgi:hypothetical protein
MTCSPFSGIFRPVLFTGQSFRLLITSGCPCPLYSLWHSDLTDRLPIYRDLPVSNPGSCKSTTPVLQGTKYQSFNQFWCVFHHLSPLSPPLNPLQIKQFEPDMLTSLTFLPRCLLTANRAGVVKQWVRPLALRPRGEAKSQRNARSGSTGD